MLVVPATWYGRATLGGDGVASKLFIISLLSKSDVGIQFLKDLGLLCCSMACGCYKCFERNRQYGHR